MKKTLVIVLVAAMLLIPLASADMKIESKSVNPVVLREFSMPAEYNIAVTPGSTIADYYYINTLLDMEFSPTEIGTILPGGSKGVQLKISPSEDFKKNYYGNTAIEYFVRGDKTPLSRAILVLSVLPMADFVNIGMPTSITIDDSKMTINLSSKTDYSDNVKLKISSELFNTEVPVRLAKEAQEIGVDVDTKDKDAKVYMINFEFTIGNESAVVQKELILGPSIAVTSSQSVSGNILSREFDVTKTNTGNSPTKATIEMSRSMWTSLFTVTEGNPAVTKDGANYVYTWEKVLNPKESFTAVLRVNYYLPFLILLLIIVAFAVYRAVTKSQIEVKKTAVRVKTKSGLFASKIILTIKNKGGAVSNLKLIDRLPAFTELLPERFGILEPTEIKKRSLIWEFPKLDKAEEIMFSYIVYSKVTIFGRLEVPSAIVTFVDRRADAKETFSNKVFILAEEEARQEKF